MGSMSFVPLSQENSGTGNLHSGGGGVMSCTKMKIRKLLLNLLLSGSVYTRRLSL